MLSPQYGLSPFMVLTSISANWNLIRQLTKREIAIRYRGSVLGVLWAFLHPEQVQGFEAVLLTRVPAGADLIAFGLTAGLWPVLLLVPTLCGI